MVVLLKNRAQVRAEYFRDHVLDNSIMSSIFIEIITSSFFRFLECLCSRSSSARHDVVHLLKQIPRRVIRIVRPKKLLYMAVDGCAPRAKMNQQRQRRFRAAQERDEQAAEMEKLKQEWEAEGRKLPPKQALSAAFDSNVITPGRESLGGGLWQVVLEQIKMKRIPQFG